MKKLKEEESLAFGPTGIANCLYMGIYPSILRGSFHDSSIRDVIAGATGATTVAPKFSDTLTLFQPGGIDSTPSSLRLHQKCPCGYISEYY